MEIDTLRRERDALALRIRKSQETIEEFQGDAAHSDQEEAMTADKTIRRGAAWFIAVTIAGTAAQAQPSNESSPRSPSPSYDIVAPPPLTPADMVNYCVYNNRVYSLGAGLCIGRTPYVCFPSPGPSTGNRAYWASREDQNFLRPICN